MSGPFGSSSFNHLVSTGFYNDVVNQSLRFEDGDSAYMSRTPSGAGNQKTWTWSGWVKKTQANTSDIAMFSAHGGGDTWFLIGFSGSNAGIDVDWYNGSTRLARKYSNQVFKDPSAWYNVVVAVDTTDSTADDRIKVYINSTQITSWSVDTNPSQDSDTYINSTNLHTIGKNASTSRTTYFDGYLAEVNLIDGLQLTPTSFGEDKNGIWIPKLYTGSYGTNGFRLQFIGTGTSTSSGSVANPTNIGDDSSGQNNHFAVTNLAASDSNMPDCPENNFATLNSLTAPGGSLDYLEGNLKLTRGSADAYSFAMSTLAVKTGKWYAELRPQGTITANNHMVGICITNIKDQSSSDPHLENGQINYVAFGNGHVDAGGSIAASTFSGSTSFGAGDVIGVALDLDSGTRTVKFYKNNSLVNTSSYGNLSSDFDNAHIGFMSILFGTNTCVWNFGQDSTFAGQISAGGNADANGIGDFAYAPPSGHLALCTKNFSDDDFATIGPSQSKQANDFFDVLTYSGTNSSQNVTGLNFKPDWVLIKSRSHSSNPTFFDSSRTPVGTALFANLTNANTDNTANFTAFRTDGFTVASNGGDTNLSGRTYVAWNWKANGGSASTISADSVSSGVPSVASSVQADTNSGFSIVTFPANNTNATKVAHGLGAVPKLIIAKETGATSDWYIYHVALGNNKYARFNNTNTEGEVSSSTVWGNTTPDSNTFTIGNNATGFAGGGSNDAIAYCFAEIEGYSKFGIYHGNGSSDGTFVYCGFRPRFFIMFLFSSASLHLWFKYDTKRGEGLQPINPEVYFSGQSYDAESTFAFADFNANGIKIRTDNSARNPDGGEFLFWAFAEAPIKYANARY